MMTQTKYIKSFNKGQITIPKEFREAFGMTEEFWLKLYILAGRIIAEPIEKKKNKTEYVNSLLTIKGSWLIPSEIANTKKQLEKQIAKRSL